MASARLISIDVGAAHVACGVFVAEAEGGLVLQEFAVEIHGADPAAEAGWGERTAQALWALANRLDLGGAAVFTVPGHLALTKSVKTPSVSPGKRGKIILFEAAQAVPYPLKEVRWSHAVVADDGAELELRFTAVKLETMERLCAATAAAGITVCGAVPSCEALQRAFRYNYPEVTGPVLVADIGARSTTLLLLGPERVQVRTVALAGNMITQAIAENFQLDFAQTEALKTRSLGGDPAASPSSRPPVQRATSHFAAQLEVEINRFLACSLAAPSAMVPAVLYVTGGGSLMAGLPAALGEKLAVRVERYDPVRRVKLSERAAGAGASAHLLANLVGLAQLAATDRAGATALLPPGVRLELVFRRRRYWLLAAAILLILALTPPLCHYERLAELTDARTREIEAQLRPRQALASRNAGNLAKLQAVQAQVATLRGLVEAKTRWVEFLADLQERLAAVEDGWLDQMKLVRRPGSAGPGLELALSGRLLDPVNPGSNVSAESHEKVRRLCASLAASPFVTRLKDERFDNTRPGLLRFDLTLVMNPRSPL
jgi:type IV pilus assembly protein PilM